MLRGIMAAGVAVTLLAGCAGTDQTVHPSASATSTASSPPAAPSPTVGGTLTLTDTAAGKQFLPGEASGRGWAVGGLCSGTGGYDDIGSGTQVTLTDETGRIIGTTSLGFGTATSSSECRFEFTFGPAPDAAFYSVEVGRRGKITESRTDLAAAG